MQPKLIVKNTASGQEFEFELAYERAYIGRAYGQNNLLLIDEKVSRRHAMLRRANDSFVISDLASANGTLVNGKRVKDRALEDKDVITIGCYDLTYCAPEAKPAVVFDNGQLGSTVVLRTPDQISYGKSGAATRLLSSERSSVRLSEDDTETLRKKAETLTYLYEFSRVLGSLFSLQDIFKKVSEILFCLTPADRYVVLRKDAKQGQLSPFATQHRKTEGESIEEISISKTVLNRVLAEQVALLSIDAQADDRLAQTATLKSQRVNSVMCAPLLGKEGPLGVIYVDCRNMHEKFSADDLDLLNALTVETSMAVDNAMTHEQLVREALARAAYGRFLPQHVVDEILADPNRVNLGGTNQQVTTLFSDIRGFTSLSERLRPEVIVRLLNKYFADMTPIVFDHQGMLDKYMGDGLMALFGVAYQSDAAAIDAVSAAAAMQRRMARLNCELKQCGLPEIAIGIGINTGVVTVGYIGSQERTDYTAIGDAVNLAARLEKQAEANQIIISQDTLDAIGESFAVRPCGRVEVKGKREPVQIFEVLWDHADEAALEDNQRMDANDSMCSPAPYYPC
jgi:adenylate cyclase